MAQGFARFYRRFWADERVRQLGPEEKLVAAYLLTGQSNRIGLFRFSVGLAEDDIGIPRKRLLTLLDTVCHTLSWGYDKGSSVVWVRSWWRWNPPGNEKAMIGYLKDLADIPKSRLLADFRNNRDTLPDTLWDTLCQRVSMPEPMPEPEPKPYPEPQPEPREREARTLIPPPRELVVAYCAKRASEGHPPVDPGRFMDYHDRCGWKLKNGVRMVDWQATIRTWEGNAVNGSAKPDRGRQIQDFAAKLREQEVARGSQ